MEGDTYLCEKCGSTLLKSNKLLHDLRCTSQNNNNININIHNTNNINLDTNITKENALLLKQIKEKLDIMNHKIDNLELYSDSDNNSESNSKNRYQFGNEDEDDDEVSDYGVGNDNDNDNDGTKIEINNNFYNFNNDNRNRGHNNFRYISSNQNHRNNNINNYSNNQRNNFRNNNYGNNQRNNNDYRYFGNINLNNRNNHANRNFSNYNNYLENEDIQDEDDLDFRFGEGNQGINKNIINNYPISKIKDVDKLMEEKRKCCICFEDYKNDDEVLTLPCIHLFHSKCIKAWTERQNKCPICKYELK